MKLFLDNPHLFEYFGLVIVLLIVFSATFLIKQLIPARKWVGIGLMIVPTAYFYILLDAHVVNIP